MSLIVKIGKMANRRVFFSVGILMLVMIIFITFFPQSLCVHKRRQCEQYQMTQNRMERIAILLEHFQLQERSFPEDLVVLEKALEKTQRELLKTIKTDPWNNLFIYTDENDKKNFSLYSMGQNNKDEFGQGDDIVFKAKRNVNIYCD